MASRIIYDLYKDDEYIGDYDGVELQEKLEMTQASFSNAANEGRLIRGHYRVIPVDRRVPRNSPLLKEFGIVTSKLLRKAGKK